MSEVRDKIVSLLNSSKVLFEENYDYAEETREYVQKYIAYLLEVADVCDLKHEEEKPLPMEYQREWKVKVLWTDEYRGYRYYVCSMGPHPCAYVENKDGYDYGTEKGDQVPCHGGVTYGGRAYWNEEDDKQYIGWDYAHCDDYSGMYNYEQDPYWQSLKKWTTQEIIDEVVEVIDWLCDGPSQLEEDE